MLLTRSPLYSSTEVDFLARLACVKHAASVHSEPGSNSPVENPDRHRPANASTAFVYLIQSPLSRRSQRFTYHWRYCLVRQLLPMRNRHWFPSIQFSKNRRRPEGRFLNLQQQGSSVNPKPLIDTRWLTAPTSSRSRWRRCRSATRQSFSKTTPRTIPGRDGNLATKQPDCQQGNSNWPEGPHPQSKTTRRPTIFQR